MNLKQKLSLFSAAILPSVALSAYFLVIPISSAADGSCPGDEVPALCHLGTFQGCSDGHDSCSVGFGQFGSFVFCLGPDGKCGLSGPGKCLTGGCVSCTYGDCD